MEKICKNCGKSFEAKRSIAQYCSVKCRVKSFTKKLKGKPVKDRTCVIDGCTNQDKQRI